MKTYPKMKDSGIKWIKKIPEHWDVKRLKFTTKFDLSTVDRHEDHEFQVSICHYPQVYNNEKIIDLTELSSGTCTKKEIEKFRLKKDDVLITKDSETPDDIGVPAYVVDDLQNTVCGYHVAQLTTNKKELLGLFLFRFIQSDVVNAYFETESNGVTRFGLGKDSIANLNVVIPSILEQNSISCFIDIETSKINLEITKNQKLIKLLKEKHQSIINHAVTKGLDPTVPMKNSGIEWIGKIPQHWEFKKIKWDTNVMRGASPRPIDDPKYFDDDGEFSWVRISDVTSSNGFLKQTEQKLSELGANLSVKLNVGELFLSIAGSVGKQCITHIPCCIHDGFVYFPMLKLLKKYLYFIFEAGECYKGLGKLGTQLNLNTDTIGNIVVPYPPKNEQKLIADYLDNQTSKINSLIHKTEIQIEKLHELRQSLISSVVTGKINVLQEIVT